MKTVNFTAKMFVTLSYKGCTWTRNAEETKSRYIKSWAAKNLFITEAQLVKANKKSGRHDGYAIGNHYIVKGRVEVSDTCTNETAKFMVFHNARTDYFNCRPLIAIKLYS